MARVGLSGRFECAYANDIDPMKCAAYRANFPDDEIVQGDIWDLDPKKPCPPPNSPGPPSPARTFRSPANSRGLNAPRSGAFWGFWNIDREPRPSARAENHRHRKRRRPSLLASRPRLRYPASRQLADAGYRVGAMLIDAALFSPQSRQRLFIVAHKGKLPSPRSPRMNQTPYLSSARRCAPPSKPCPTPARMAWVWWRLPHPPRRNADLASLLERNPPEGVWRSDAATQKHLMAQMAPLHRQRVEAALADREMAGRRRLPPDPHRERESASSAAEIRYDGLAGCLRTPAGGSSKQLLLVTENGRARLRPMLAREAARLMGLEDSYRLPAGETAALKLSGDGVSVPVVRWLGEHLLAPLAGGAPGEGRRLRRYFFARAFLAGAFFATALLRWRFLGGFLRRGLGLAQRASHPGHGRVCRSECPQTDLQRPARRRVSCPWSCGVSYAP